MLKLDFTKTSLYNQMKRKMCDSAVFMLKLGTLLRIVIFLIFDRYSYSCDTCDIEADSSKAI